MTAPRAPAAAPAALTAQIAALAMLVVVASWLARVPSIRSSLSTLEAGRLAALWVAAGSFGALAATRFAESLVEGPEREGARLGEGLRVLASTWGGERRGPAAGDPAGAAPAPRGRPPLPPRGLAGAGLAPRAPASSGACSPPSSPRAEDPLTEELCDFRALIEPHGSFGGLPEPFTLSHNRGRGGDGTWERVVGPLVLPGGGAFACWRRAGPLRTGWKAASEYLSRTVVPGLSADEAMRFYLDDARRQRWDTMLQTTEVAWPKADREERRAADREGGAGGDAEGPGARPGAARGSSPYAPHGEVIRWVRSFPVSFVTPREYVMLRRAWSAGRGLDQEGRGARGAEAAPARAASGGPGGASESSESSDSEPPAPRARASGGASASMRASKSSPSLLAAGARGAEGALEADAPAPPVPEEGSPSSARVLYAVMRAAPRDERAPPPSRAVRVERMDSTWRCRALTIEEVRAEAGATEAGGAPEGGGDALFALVLRELAAGRGAPPPGAPPPVISETMLLHREDLGVPDRLARMAVKVGMTPVVKAMARAMAEAAEAAMRAKASAEAAGAGRDGGAGGAGAGAGAGGGAGATGRGAREEGRCDARASTENAVGRPRPSSRLARESTTAPERPSLWARATRAASRVAAAALVAGGVLLIASSVRSGGSTGRGGGKRAREAERGEGGGGEAQVERPAPPPERVLAAAAEPERRAAASAV